MGYWTKRDWRILQVLYKFDEQLHSLSVINLTKQPRVFLQFGLFLNLRRLSISAQHMDDDFVQLISGLQYLQRLTIVQARRIVERREPEFQDEKTLGALSCSRRAWTLFANSNNYTRISLVLKGTTNGKEPYLIYKNYTIAISNWRASMFLTYF